MDSKLLIFVIFQLIASGISYDCKPNSGRWQSPINIDKNKAFSKTAPKLIFSEGYNKARPCRLVNVGHSFNLEVASGSRPQLSGGVTKAVYDFQQLHFHWGTNDSIGGEHTINGQSYAMEMHVVSQQTANSNIDQYAVIGFLFTVSSKDNPALAPIVKALPKAPHTNNSVIIENFVLANLVDTKLSRYYTYEGSLTTEPYTESVQWLLSTKILDISENQIKAFRTAAKKECHMVNNFRCIQPLNGRTVYLVK